MFISKLVLKVDLKKTRYIMKCPKTFPNFSNNFIAQNLTMLNGKCIWRDLCILVPQQHRLLLVHTQAPIGDMHLASFFRETMVEHIEVQALGIQP